MACIFILLAVFLKEQKFLILQSLFGLFSAALFFFPLLSSWYVKGNRISLTDRARHVGHAPISWSAHHFPEGQEAFWGRGPSDPRSSTASLLSVWSSNQRHGHHRGACYKCGICILRRCPGYQYIHYSLRNSNNDRPIWKKDAYFHRRKREETL